MTEFERIYRAYFTQVQRYLLALCRDAHLAEELTAQTFFKAMNSLKTYRGDSDIRTWLCAIGRNCYISHLRKNGRFVPLEELTLQDPGQCPEQHLADKEEAAAIRKAMERLTEPYKQVFFLRVLEQLSFSDIGELYGKTQNWACVTYHRAKKKIMEEMEVPK